MKNNSYIKFKINDYVIYEKEIYKIKMFSKTGDQVMIVSDQGRVISASVHLIELAEHFFNKESTKDWINEISL